MMQAGIQFRDLFDQTPYGFVITDLDGVIADANQKCCGQLGKPVNELIGLPFSRFIVEDHRGQFDQQLAEIAAGSKPVEEVSDLIVVVEPGDLTPFQAELTPFGIGGADQCLEYLGWAIHESYFNDGSNLFTDALTVLHEIDKTILSSTSLDDLLSDVLPLVDKLIPCDQICILGFEAGDPEAEVLGLLRCGEDKVRTDWMVPLGHGWPPADLAENEIVEFSIAQGFDIHPDLKRTLISDRSEVLMSVPLIDRGKMLGSMNVSMTTGDHPAEVLRPIIVQVANQMAIGIRQIRLVETQQHYTGELETLAEERAVSLSASEARFRTVFEDAAFGIATLDKNGLVIDANESLRQILGFEQGELVGKSLLDFGHPDDVHQAADLFAQLIRDEIKYFEYEGRFRRQDGAVRWGKHTISRVKEEKHAEPTVAIALMEDFTEAVVHQEALLSAERFAITGRLGASLAHEINNPLQAVIGSLGLVEEMIEDKEARRLLSVAMEELERTARIADQLRSLGKPVVYTEKQLVDINDLLERTLLMTSSKRLNARVSLEWDKTGDLPRLKVSPEPVQQVFLNLVINAIQAMADGGVLEIRTSATARPAGILVMIKDSGHGIPADIQEKMFEPFFSTRASGLGLGLYLSRQIVEQHKGKIHITSDEGRGTVVSVWLPAEEEIG